MAVPDWIWFVFIFAFGCCVGSFLNVVIYRLPRDKSLITPPSACPACGGHIRFYDNIPLVSWLLLGRSVQVLQSPNLTALFCYRAIDRFSFSSAYLFYIFVPIFCRI